MTMPLQDQEILPPLSEDDKMLAGLCYPFWFMIPPWILFSNKKKELFLYFHALQGLYFGAATTIFTLVSGLIIYFSIFFKRFNDLSPGENIPPEAGCFGLMLVSGVILFYLGMLMLEVFFSLWFGWKASNGSIFKLPWIGRIAYDKVSVLRSELEREYVESVIQNKSLQMLPKQFYVSGEDSGEKYEETVENLQSIKSDSSIKLLKSMLAGDEIQQPAPPEKEKEFVKEMFFSESDENKDISKVTENLPPVSRSVEVLSGPSSPSAVFSIPSDSFTPPEEPAEPRPSSAKSLESKVKNLTPLERLAMIKKMQQSSREADKLRKLVSSDKSAPSQEDRKTQKEGGEEPKEKLHEVLFGKFMNIQAVSQETKEKLPDSVPKVPSREEKVKKEEAKKRELPLLIDQPLDYTISRRRLLNFETEEKEIKKDKEPSLSPSQKLQRLRQKSELAQKKTPPVDDIPKGQDEDFSEGDIRSTIKDMIHERFSDLKNLNVKSDSSRSGKSFSADKKHSSRFSPKILNKKEEEPEGFASRLKNIPLTESQDEED